jgi:hypothetical protein
MFMRVLFQLVADVMEALVNMADVLADLWPLDNTPRILMRIMVQYKFAASVADSEQDRCKLIAEFCDGVMRQNASKRCGSCRRCPSARGRRSGAT